MQEHIHTGSDLCECVCACVLQVYKGNYGSDIPAAIKVIGGHDGANKQAAKEAMILAKERYAEVRLL